MDTKVSNIDCLFLFFSGDELTHAHCRNLENTEEIKKSPIILPPSDNRYEHTEVFLYVYNFCSKTG